MGMFNFLKSIKPSKKKLKLMREQFDSGKILSVDEGKDNIQIMNEADYNDTR